MSELTRSDTPQSKAFGVGEPRLEDDLSRFVDMLEKAVADSDYQRAAAIIQSDVTSAWFGISPARLAEIVMILYHGLENSNLYVSLIHYVITAQGTDKRKDDEFLASLHSDDPYLQVVLAIARMGEYRFNGQPVKALSQVEDMQHFLGRKQSFVDPSGGRILHTAVQAGVSAMLAGDFNRALSSFTQAQMHELVKKFSFLTRDAHVKSALIHAAFGDPTMARSLLDRASRIPRTSSWVEEHLDSHRDLAEALLLPGNGQDALEAIDRIDLHSMGEMWPFYILAVYRSMEAAGYVDEIEHRLAIFDSMPLARTDGEGFSGTVIPLIRAFIAIKTHRGTEAMQHLQRADHRLAYTKLIEGAIHIYGGRPSQALQQATRIRDDIRGLRLLELRRLAVISAAQFQLGDTAGCIETIGHATSLPRGLDPREAQLFNEEVRQLASKHVENWPDNQLSISSFLGKLPKHGAALTEREIQILKELEKSKTRAEIARDLYISLNTLKSQLQSIYRKIDVTSGKNAVLEAQRRGLI